MNEPTENKKRKGRAKGESKPLKKQKSDDALMLNAPAKNLEILHTKVMPPSGTVSMLDCFCAIVQTASVDLPEREGGHADAGLCEDGGRL